MPDSNVDSSPVDLILHNGRIATMDPARPNASAVAMRPRRRSSAGP